MDAAAGLFLQSSGLLAKLTLLLGWEASIAAVANVPGSNVNVPQQLRIAKRGCGRRKRGRGHWQMGARHIGAMHVAEVRYLSGVFNGSNKRGCVYLSVCC